MNSKKASENKYLLVKYKADDTLGVIENDDLISSANEACPKLRDEVRVKSYDFSRKGRGPQFFEAIILGISGCKPQLTSACSSMESTGKVWFLDEEREMGRNRRGVIPKSLHSDSDNDSWGEDVDVQKLKGRSKKMCISSGRIEQAGAQEEEWLGIINPSESQVERVSGEGDRKDEEIRRLKQRIQDLEDQIMAMKGETKALTELVRAGDYIKECRSLYTRMKKDANRQSAPERNPLHNACESERPVSPVKLPSVSAVDVPTPERDESTLDGESAGDGHDTIQLKYKCMSKNLQELIPGSKIYLSRTSFLGIKSGVKHTSRLTVAKALLEEVFSEDALLSCSPLGTNSGSGPRRPALYAPAYKAILDASDIIGTANNFPVVTVKNYNHALGSKLSKLREAHNIRARVLQEPQCIL